MTLTPETQKIQMGQFKNFAKILKNLGLPRFHFRHETFFHTQNYAIPLPPIFLIPSQHHPKFSKSQKNLEVSRNWWEIQLEGAKCLAVGFERISTF